MNAPAQQQTNVEMTTDPNPPHKGSNTVRVKLTGQDGKPIAGANVTVTFFMAAMPAMGMAAMKTVINASNKGGGMYEGKGDLGSGGSLQLGFGINQEVGRSDDLFLCLYALRDHQLIADLRPQLDFTRLNAPFAFVDE